jgi:hypothetical protein
VCVLRTSAVRVAYPTLSHEARILKQGVLKLNVQAV